jgi:hypothetical protein
MRSQRAVRCRFHREVGAAAAAVLPRSPPSAAWGASGAAAAPAVRAASAPSSLVSARLRSDDNPIPTLPDGGIDLACITKLSITEVVDYHRD